MCDRRRDKARHSLALAAVFAALGGSFGCTSDRPGIATPVHVADGGGTDAANDPVSLATEAFIWGYPAVVSQRTLQTLAVPLGVDKLFNQTALSTPAIRLIVAPNHDTLYSVAVLDLRGEPMVLTVPDVTDRYWVYQFLDTWTDSFDYVGTRATNGKGGTFVITPPGFSGAIPAGLTQIASPTPQLFLLGRYLVKNDADLATVNAIPRTMVPLSTVTGTPPATVPPPLGTAKGTPQEVGDDGASFFDELGDVLAVNGPATDADKASLARFASLGIGPGLHPTRTADAGAAGVLAAGVTAGLAKIDDAANGISTLQNGWTVRLNIGTYDDPLIRAAVAKFAWGANVPAEAVYPVSRADAEGRPYTGASRYVLHFDADALPPVDPTLGFWSLTLYGTDLFFVENPLHRYAIGDRTDGIAHNADGSLDLYIQTDAPTGHTGNWLPAPAGQFYLMLRFYLPEKPILDGTYVYPKVTLTP